jgi:putative transposase
VDQQELAQQLLAQAKEQGIDLVGPDGLLNRLTKNVLETALEAEMDQHLGYEKHDVSGRGSGNSRNGTRTKTVLTEIWPVEIDVPRDTGSTFDPQNVNKRRRRLTGVDEIVLSLSAKGLTTGEIAAHFAEVFGARVSKDTISWITEKVIGEMTEWQNRPLDRGQFLVNVADPRERDSHAQIRVEQDAAGGETPLLRTDPSGVLGL